jgi:glyoxylase-like metal-dependent hydrolase (beta-lactamase superfamily II)
MPTSTTSFGLGDDIVVETIADIPVMDMPLSLIFPSVDPAAFAPHLSWLEPDHFTAATATLHLACHAFVVRHGGKIILIDTCVGCGKPRPLRPAWNTRADTLFLDGLRAAGIAPEQVDIVFCSHLHADHVGWNTVLSDGRWVPTFPNARYLIGRTEMAYWDGQAAQRGLENINHGAHVDSVLPVVAAGQVDLVDDGFDLAPGFSLRSMAGHTPGQMGLRIDRGATRALFCGDAMHSPIQIIHPDWPTAFCADSAAAAATRRAMFSEAIESGRVILPAHLRGTPYFRVAADGDGFRPQLGGK